MKVSAKLIIRPRMLLYGIILLSLFVGLMYAISQRTLLDISIIQDRNALYKLQEGLIENVYTIKIMNLDNVEHTYLLSMDGITGAKLLLNQQYLSCLWSCWNIQLSIHC
ncbi:MAG: FixG Ig-like domain-containing protein [Thiotrichaceae bacterium]